MQVGLLFDPVRGRGARGRAHPRLAPRVTDMRPLRGRNTEPCKKQTTLLIIEICLPNNGLNKPGYKYRAGQKTKKPLTNEICLPNGSFRIPGSEGRVQKPYSPKNVTFTK